MPPAVFGHGVAHPPAVAWRVVLKYLVDGLTYAQICQDLQPMSVGSVHNILARFEADSDVDTHQGENVLGPPNKIMTYDRVARLLDSMLANKAAGDGDEMLQEIYEDFLEREGVVLDIATLCRTIRDHGFSRNTVPGPVGGPCLSAAAPACRLVRCASPPQLSHLARHRDAVSADRFRQHMNRVYHMSLTLWIDESHVDNRSRRRCGRQRHGSVQPAAASSPRADRGRGT